MQSNRCASLAIPILIIIVGVGWLLTTQGIAPGINWVWSLGLAAVGILTFVLGGFNKVTLALGPFFLLASVLSVLRQTGHLSLDVELPVLVISIGVLLLLVQAPAIPAPHWIEVPPASPEKSNAPKRLRL